MIFKNIQDIAHSRRFDYKRIEKKTTRSTSDASRDLNVIIPLKNRCMFVEPCIKYLLRASKKASLKISIALVENDDYPTYPWKHDNLISPVEYLSIPLILSQSGCYINKALCFNVGYRLIKPASWYLFHDVDMLVDDDFFINIEKGIKSNPPFAQPYSKKKVYTLGYESTKAIINKKRCVHLKDIEEKAYSREGVSGGSVLVRRDIFELVGGYDPEFFYGYAPEDNFFWAKLEVACSSGIEEMVDHHVGNGVYMDEPPMDIYHMFHVPEVSLQNNLSEVMNDIHYFFLNADYKTKNKVLGLKRKFLSS